MHELPPLSVLARAAGGEPARLPTPALSLAERRDAGFVRLSVDLKRDADLRGGIEAVAGPLPGPNQWSERALWQGPAEWLLASAPDAAQALAARLQSGFDGRAALANDATDGLVVIEVSGPGARDRLAGGTGVALDPAPGRLALTRLGDVRVTLLFDGPDFRLIVERSLADYLWSWLSR
ncbi:MAG: sarcosine oxidase subunit gamma family protein [Caulobacteraceae bacterium]|nr:sarcosine oxidase subunit gamma family protein [Caulobacteraceae bacterium]